MKAFQIISLIVLAGFLQNVGSVSLLATENYFDDLRRKRIESDPTVEWKNFGPGMSGYCEEFWCHPSDADVMFMGPDMHVSYGTWDKGQTWQTLKDSDGLGQEMKRVLDIEFSLQDPDFGMAIDWNGWLYKTTDCGKSWSKQTELANSYRQAEIDPDGPKTFAKGWYYQQMGTRMAELAVDPTDDSVWYVGAGDFWNVKANHKSAAKPHGVELKYADYGYILKSTDKGRTWEKHSQGLPANTDVAKIIVNPKLNTNIIMATNCGLFLSQDGGHSWSKSGSGLPNNLPRDLTSYFDPESNTFVLYLLEQTVYKAQGSTVTCQGGVYRSADGGETWKDITGNLYLDLNQIQSTATIQRFHRAMAHWFGISVKESKQMLTELPPRILPVFNRLVVNPLNYHEIYISHNKKHDFSFGPGDVWRTLDSGEDWIACARHGTYWKSQKDRQYWRDRGNPLGTNIAFAHLQRYMDHATEKSGNRMLAVNSTGDFFIGIDQQTLRSTNQGDSWEQIDDLETSPCSDQWIGRGGSNLPGRFMLHETGIPERRLLCCGEHGLWQTAKLDGWDDRRAIAVEQIEGQVHKNGAHSISTVAVHPHDPSIIYTLSWRQEHRGKLRRTTDGGKHWKNIATIFKSDNASWENLVSQNSLIIDPENPQLMYFCATREPISEISLNRNVKLTMGNFGFYRSSDGGYHWELSNDGFDKKASIRRIFMHPKDPAVLFAAANDHDGGLYMTNDRGSNWKRMTIPDVIKSVNNVFVDRNSHDIFISTGRRKGEVDEGGVWRSTDQGKTWSRIFEAPFVWQAESSPVNPKLIVISVAGQAMTVKQPFMNPGVYLSKDGGKSWSKINRGLGQPDKIVDVKPDPFNENVLWCASWGCGWFVAYLEDSTAGWLRQ